MLLMDMASSAAKWVAGLGGVTIALALSLSISAYTSFIQGHDCQTRLMASEAVLAGPKFAIPALIGALLALAGSQLPQLLMLKWRWQSIRDTANESASQRRSRGFRPQTGFIYVCAGLIGLGALFVFPVPLKALSAAQKQTPAYLAHFHLLVADECSKENGL